MTRLSKSSTIQFVQNPTWMNFLAPQRRRVDYRRLWGPSHDWGWSSWAPRCPTVWPGHPRGGMPGLAGSPGRSGRSGCLRGKKVKLVKRSKTHPDSGFWIPEQLTSMPRRTGLTWHRRLPLRGARLTLLLLLLLLLLLTTSGSTNVNATLLKQKDMKPKRTSTFYSVLLKVWSPAAHRGRECRNQISLHNPQLGSGPVQTPGKLGG